MTEKLNATDKKRAEKKAVRQEQARLFVEELKAGYRQTARPADEKPAVQEPSK